MFTRGYHGSRSEEHHQRPLQDDENLEVAKLKAMICRFRSQPKWALKQPRWWFHHRMSIEFHEPWEIEASFMDFMAIQATFSVDSIVLGIRTWWSVSGKGRFAPDFMARCRGTWGFRPWDCCCTKMSLDPRCIDLYYTYIYIIYTMNGGKKNRASRSRMRSIDHSRWTNSASNVGLLGWCCGWLKHVETQTKNGMFTINWCRISQPSTVVAMYRFSR